MLVAARPGVAEPPLLQGRRAGDAGRNLIGGSRAAGQQHSKVAVDQAAVVVVAGAVGEAVVAEARRDAKVRRGEVVPVSGSVSAEGRRGGVAVVAEVE